MDFGVLMFMTDYAISAPALAQALEERGFESLWVPEHSHIPLSRKTPFPGGGDLPKQYYDAMDPFVMLSAAAAVTGAHAAAGYGRRRLTACRTPRGALRQRLGPDRRARAVWRHRRLPAEVQGDAERGRPQIRGRAEHADGRRRGCRSAEALSR